eukprot:CAMPEP_0181212376 /NCGR_PEP_ID=MMETSP1096-20121128/24315_1 /TAXON_ID=156174 ORGANISM="Chrysochromulina ericina, Strain CCMP281" /NCGR_SAMPLE_ID=MMETSP1096 /ASSEMBLY_ACC=CAM_ASM_000453 /LENGTH=139 /DNA_ID=CAMNT_0023303897 /DNA_START=268 /DNA_END=684 /DNA_ORIENTATION=+
MHASFHSLQCQLPAFNRCTRSLTERLGTCRLLPVSLRVGGSNGAVPQLWSGVSFTCVPSCCAVDLILLGDIAISASDADGVGLLVGLGIARASFSLSWGAGAVASASVFLCGGAAVKAAAFFSLSWGAGAVGVASASVF